MEDPELEPEQGLDHANYDYSNIHTYSDLVQDYYEIGTGCAVDVTDHLALFTNLEYIKFSDNEIWVYGDQTGRWYAAQVGATVSF